MNKKKGPGRPKGSKNKKGPGRPKGSKNQKKELTKKKEPIYRKIDAEYLDGRTSIVGIFLVSLTIGLLLTLLLAAIFEDTDLSQKVSSIITTQMVIGFSIFLVILTEIIYFTYLKKIRKDTYRKGITFGASVSLKLMLLIINISCLVTLSFLISLIGGFVYVLYRLIVNCGIEILITLGVISLVGMWFLINYLISNIGVKK